MVLRIWKFYFLIGREELKTSALGIVHSLWTVSFISSRFYMADVLGILYYIDTIHVQLVS
jgi:hypothetical protein